MINRKEVKNPLFKTNDITLLRTISVRKIIQKWKKEYQIDVESNFANIDTLYLYEEKSTGIQFFHPIISTETPEIYQELHNFSWYHIKSKWEFLEASIDLKDSNTILEVGAGHGHFVKLMQKTGKTILGIELNSSAVEIAQNEKLNICLASMNDLQNKGMMFDAICSFQVLEHTANPRQFLKDMIQLLSPGGLLILSVPNADSFIKHEFNVLNMPPHHMTRWKKLAFESLEHEFPIKLKQTKFSPLAKYHIKGFVNAYFSYFRKRSFIFKLLFNTISAKICIFFLHKLAFLRTHITGQDLYVCFKKI